MPLEGRSPHPDKPPPWLNRWLITACAILLGVAAVVWVIVQLATLLLMIFIALFLAVALGPAVDWLEKRRWNRRWATAVVFLAAFFLGVLFLATLLPLFINQTAAIAVNLPEYLSTIENWLGRFMDVDLLDVQIRDQLEDLGSLLQQYGGQVAGGVLAVGSTLAGVVFQGVTILLFAFYMVAEAPKMLRLVLSLFPARRQRLLLRIWEVSIEKTGGYVYSRLILSVVSAVITATVLAFLSVPYPVALGIWVGVLSQFIPVIGTYIGGALPVLIALLEDPITALWVLLFIVAYQQVENLVISPRVTSRTMAIHPAVSVGAVIAGGSILGALGAVLALPVAAIVQSLISTSRKRHELVVELEGDDRPDH
ncbi:MAG: AI-2E family transporter [Acidimicrobiia bacterium]|nr:AI-2E family transporter [bacterium]MXX00178.1 AI-2E family transporter [Acidimicrobiia bacterium]MXX44983.1 AI-2E family transporter [Acidimicrobiia bacterium]MXY73975.1 AI-2E family transporter [Acidimicrobiia bacterium]MYA39212.1 AI-2E family transporter [Acidimicrobiia bacterium]